MRTSLLAIVRSSIPERPLRTSRFRSGETVSKRVELTLRLGQSIITWDELAPGDDLMADPTPPILLERLRQQPVDSDSWRRFVELYAAWLGAWVVRLARPLAGGPATLAGEQDQEEVVGNVLLRISREVDTG